MTQPAQRENSARPLWYWLLITGALAQVAVAAALLSLDRSAAPSNTARDIALVGTIGLIGGFVVCAAIPNAEQSKPRRMVILVALAAVTVVTAFGMITRAVQPWAAAPFILMTVATVALYTAMRASHRN